MDNGPIPLFHTPCNFRRAPQEQEPLQLHGYQEQCSDQRLFSERPAVWEHYTNNRQGAILTNVSAPLFLTSAAGGMDMTKRSIAIYLLTSLVGLAGAQTRPDFTGTWKQNLEKSSTKSSWLKSYVNKIEQQDTNLKVTTTTVGDRGERTYDRTYVIGKEEKSQDREGDQFTTNVKWEGNTLVFETVEKEHDAVLTSKEVWTLSDGGKTLTKNIHRSGPKGDSDQTYVLERQ